MLDKIIKAPAPSAAQLNTLFNHKLLEALAWRMQHAERFSTDDHQIKGTDIQVWDIVIGEYNDYVGTQFAIVVATGKTTNDCDHCEIMQLSQYNNSFSGFIQVCDACSIYFKRNNSYRTITEYELAGFWAALEATHA